jgi:HPt (histidine-containing phosphotransfer) domain-containing protein
LRIIREEIGTEYARTVPVIAFTANALAGSDELFLNKHFQDFLSKPIDIMRMDAVIKRWLRNKDREAELRAAGADKKGGVEKQDGGGAEQGPETGGGGQADEKFRTAIEGLDFQQGLELFDGDSGLYRDLLRSYMESTPAILDQLRRVTPGTLGEYRIRVHGVKSSSFSIGAFAVGQKAEALEGAAKMGDFSFVSEHNDELIRGAEKLLDDIKELLANAPLKQR